MAHLVIVINSPESISELNSKIQRKGSSPEALNNVANYISAINSANVSASVQVTVRDSDPAVATSGSGSTQESYS
jgi:hypothetical protein